MLSADPAPAFAFTASAPPAPSDQEPEVYLRRARVQVGLAAIWRDVERARLALKMLDEVPTRSGLRKSQAAEARGDAWAVIALTAKEPGDAWKQAEASYRIALIEAAADCKAKLHNNLGMALARQDQTEAAKTSWEAVARFPSERKWTARMNLAALGVRRGEAKAADELDKLADELRKQEGKDGKLADEDELPLPLLQHLKQAARAAKNGKRIKALGKSIAGALGRIKRERITALTSEGEGAIVNFGAFQFNLGCVSGRESYVLELTLASEPWLIFPPGK